MLCLRSREIRPVKVEYKQMVYENLCGQSANSGLHLKDVRVCACACGLCCSEESYMEKLAVCMC